MLGYFTGYKNETLFQNNKSVLAPFVKPNEAGHTKLSLARLYRVPSLANKGYVYSRGREESP